MPTDYIVSSLPALQFDAPAPISWESFAEMCGGNESINALLAQRGWPDLETQLRNAMAEARGGAKYVRPATGCSVYWKRRVDACFQEFDVSAREKQIDKVWWDAAGELAPPESPLGKGALAAYAVRLKIAIRRDGISSENGNKAFDRLTAEKKTT